MGGILSGGQQQTSSNMAGVREEIDKQIAEFPVYVVEKRSCPFCKTAKVLLEIDHPNKKALVSRPSTANFAFRPAIKCSIPSLFHADQRGA